jgi:hypothetical protein
VIGLYFAVCLIIFMVNFIIAMLDEEQYTVGQAFKLLFWSCVPVVNVIMLLGELSDFIFRGPTMKAFFARRLW